MIGKLKGLIDSYGEDFVILDVGGVGYQVHCTGRTLQALPAQGEAAVLSIETYVREDATEAYLVAVNLTEEAQEGTATGELKSPAPLVFGDGALETDGASIRVKLPASGAAIFRAR